MTQYIKSIIYGIVQGLTEFLPVSSSGHLAVFQNVFGAVDEQLSGVTFTLLMHVGTLAAVLVVYRKDVAGLIKSFFSLVKRLFTGEFKYSKMNTDEKLFCLLFIALIPLLLGAVLEGTVEFLSAYTFAVGLLWIINGLIFLVSEKISVKQKKFEEIKPKNALIVGLFQLFAILPGISRSGMTITGGVFNGFKRELAVKFSFILSIPAILGSVAITVLKDYKDISIGENAGVLFAGVVASFVSGFLAIKLLEYISKKNTFKAFAYYCIAIGVAAIAFDVIKMVVIGG
ncbi:MAG: undecaprenyl-diphosphate phosphatase [Clostridia bacterium]|nr:undecaprenyl-diphosphate phosphatase [Clostridia bacterium]